MIEVDAAIDKRFFIRRLLGTGSFGVVYEAFDALRHRDVALKTLPHADSATVSRFKREFRSLSELRHPNLASLYELLVINDEWTLTMELIRGTDLLEHLSFAEIQSTFLDPTSTEPFDPDARVSIRRRTPKEGRLSAVYLQHVRETFRQLAEAIAFLHANGVVHRDVKPSNVMITPQGRVVLLDFGLAMDGRSDSSIDADLIVGTPGYMSPEQISMAKPAPPSDWYSFGVMLYQALTGRRLFSGANAGEILDQQMRATPIPARDVQPGLPEELCALADRCLDRDPSQRPPAGEILETFGSSLVRARGDVREHERPAELIGRGREVRTLVRLITEFLGVPRSSSVPRVGTPRHSEEPEALRGTPHSGIVLLHGAPGVGKSVLADRVLDEIRSTTNALILGGRCHGWESLPFNAIDAIVDSVARQVRTEPSAAIDTLMNHSVAMTGLFPTLAFPSSAASNEDETVLMPPTQTQLLTRASAELHSLLTMLADGRPVVLFLDDAQWGDYQSAEVFLRLLDPSRSLPLVLILCYSTDDWRTSLLLQALLSSPIRRHEVRVEPLSAALTEKLVRRDLPDASKSLRSVIVEQADGNPGLLGQLMHHVANDATAEPLLSHAVEARLSALSTSAQRIFSLLRDENGPMAEDEVTRRLELFESDEPLRTLTRARLVRLRRTGDLFELDLYHPRLRLG